MPFAALSRPAARRFSTRAVTAWALVAAPAALAASSASHQISNAVLDAAGGTSTSPSHTLTACVGSEVAGSSSSASYHIDSGCGPSALAIPSDFNVLVAGNPTPVPTLSGSVLALLVAVLAVAAMKRLRASRP